MRCGGMRTITRKSLLYRSAVEYADYCLNHVEGCSHGCTYPCYAMLLKKRCGAVSSYDDWLRPKIVSNALELLDTELPRLRHKIERVFLCFATDPFMYEQDEVASLTKDILQRLSAAQLTSVLISKGTYPSELVDTSKFGKCNEYGATIVSLSEEFRREFEPFAAPVDERIHSLKRLHDAGLRTWISMEPYPTPNIVKQDIREVLGAVAFVDKIVIGKWNYSRRAKGFEDYNNFYDSTVWETMRFCEDNSIELHVKEGSVSPEFRPNQTAFDGRLPLSYA